MKTMGKPEMRIQPDNADAPDVSADGLVATGRALVRTQTQYSTAIQVQKPRSVEKVQKAVLDEAKLAGEDFYYAWTVNTKEGKQVVEGVSIDGALILVRNWGNCATEVNLHEDAPLHWIISASFIDHETGYTGSRLFRQRKSQSTGKMDQDRSLDIAFQIGQSKAIRNVVLNSMPSYIVNKALRAAKAAAAAEIKDLPKAIDNLIKAFANIKVTEAMLVWKIGGIARTSWSAEDVILLRSIGSSIKDKQSSVENEFGDYDDPNAPKEKKTADPKSADAKPAEGGAAEQGTPPSDGKETVDTTGEEPSRPDFE